MTEQTRNCKYKVEPEGSFYRIIAMRDFEYHLVFAGDRGGLIAEPNVSLSQEGECWVYPNARVMLNARVWGNAQIKDYACVTDKAEVYGGASLMDNASVHGPAKVYGYASLLNDAIVYQNSEVYGHALLSQRAIVCGQAKVYDNACLSGSSHAEGTSIVCGDTRLSGYHTVTDGVWKRTTPYIQGSKASVYQKRYGHLTIGCCDYTLDCWLLNYDSIGKKYGYTPDQIKEYYEYIKLFEKLGIL